MQSIITDLGVGGQGKGMGGARWPIKVGPATGLRQSSAHTLTHTLSHTHTHSLSHTHTLSYTHTRTGETLCES